MEQETWNNFFKLFLALTLLIAIDQLSKYIIRHGGGFYVCNPDIAFGIQISESVFWLFWFVIIIVILFNLRKSLKSRKRDTQKEDMHDSCFLIHNPCKIIALILILSGAVTNIIDRMVFGCVVDFINFQIWPVFNLADLFIVSGAVLWLAKFRKV